MKSRGLTLIELLIALSIGSILVVVTISTTMGSMQAAYNSTNRLDSYLDITLLSNYFAKEIPNSGGYGVPVSAGAWVENNCAARPPFPVCNGSDRLNLLQVADASNCGVAQLLGYGKVRLPKISGTCCLSGTDWTNKQILLVDATAGVYGQRTVTNADLSGCSLTYVNGPFAVADVGPDSPTTPYDWAADSSQVYPLSKLETFYLNTDLRVLHKYTYANGNVAAVDQIAADRVNDFQLALGYDSSGAGVLSDSGSATDDWLFNNADDQIGAGKFFGATQGSLSPTLRQVAVGVVIGSPGGGSMKNKTFGLFDGPARVQAGWTLESGVSKYTLRSVYQFQ